MCGCQRGGGREGERKGGRGSADGSLCAHVSCAPRTYVLNVSNDGAIHMYIQTLKTAGADAEGRTAQGFFPLHYAALEGFEEVVSVLLDANAKVSVTDSAGATPLHRAVVCVCECCRVSGYFCEHSPCYWYLCICLQCVYCLPVCVGTCESCVRAMHDTLYTRICT